MTALYELTLADGRPSIDPLRYQVNKTTVPITSKSDKIAFLKLRWKAPQNKKSKLVSLPIKKKALVSSFEQAGIETRFIAAVAALGKSYVITLNCLKHHTSR